ncbi:hypothetical protein CPT_Percy9 [Caulobacter phage Percy]|uniref:Uncharacterized protein n=1 Tax=Caulobacter phage Percy TaxID=1701809 RepID=A0A0M3UL61_9CAUD|nr:hypothetical protein CPT_Percy9 [Caulobacter phage Percy]ALF01643.1 hypothetical protein CPT_Percy9 [Caulobacter phage Percy]
MTTETTAVVVRKTTAELLALAEARVATLRAKLVAETMLNNVFEGDDIQFNYGKSNSKDGIVSKRGLVIGRREMETGVQLMVEVQGETAFDTERLKVFTRDVTVNYTRPIAEGVVEAANAEVTPEASDESDPLAAA